MKTLSLNASTISGQDSAKIAPSRKNCLNVAHPGELTSTTPTMPKNRTVLTMAIPALRAPLPPPRIRERRSPVGTGVPAPGGPDAKPSSFTVPPPEGSDRLREGRDVGVGLEPLGLQVV